MGAYNDKLVINSALGFDSYLVMRHGRPKKLLEKSEIKATPNSILVPGEKLGCYFCNDVVAPGNSTTDRTLDQQCTVTRPGASYMAGSLAVELMVSTLQHPKGSLAPALTCQNLSPEQEESIFGEVESLLGSFVPHSIRGSLHTLTQFLPTTQAFDHCTACSPKILEAFAEKGFEFIREIANTNGSEYLEKIAGLQNLMAEVNMDDIVTDFDIESD
jgi:ubiquitin-like modifier-activating enzyme ATG7